ncbi:MAG: hypothetical protein RLY89_424 [Bacteroidota bacterium]|jgi:hypothetical protein
MKQIVILIISLLVAYTSFSSTKQSSLNLSQDFVTDTLVKDSPLDLVERQLKAYNARNVDAFLEPYADDVELYEFPDKLISKGKDAMRKDYEGMFKNIPSLHCDIVGRIIQRNIVIDKESISGMGKNKFEATAIYHIEKNKIKKVYFIQ